MKAGWLAAAAAALLAGCAPAADRPGAEPSTTAASTTAPTTAAMSSASSTAPRTTPSPDPVTIEGPCPYLETGVVQETVGQHIERTTVTSTSHEVLPGCSFFRPDGDPAAVVEVTELASAAVAQTAAIELGTAAANPVDDIADGGVVLVSTEQTVLAVSSGGVLLVVTINQASSLEARALAEIVAPLLTG